MNERKAEGREVNGRIEEKYRCNNKQIKIIKTKNSKKKQHGIRTDTETLKLIDRGTDFGNDKTYGLKQKKLSQRIRKKKKRKQG